MSMKSVSFLVAVIGFAAFAITSGASYGQNPFPDGPPAVGQCIRACGQELGACLEAVGISLEACISGLERPSEIPMGIPQDIQVCLDAAEVAQVGCRTAFDACIVGCDG